MTEIIILIAVLIGLILFCIITFERSMWLSIDYWSVKQYRLWRVICAIIGSCYLIAIIILYIFSSESPDQIIKQAVILVVAAFFSMGIFSQTLHIIAWKKKCDILKVRIREFLNGKDLKNNHDKYLNIILFENQNYAKKTVKKIFSNVLHEFKQN